MNLRAFSDCYFTAPFWARVDKKDATYFSMYSLKNSAHGVSPQ